jgi:hypothetical protein
LRADDLLQLAGSAVWRPQAGLPAAAAGCRRARLEPWLPPWFLECVPSISAASAVPTCAALALRLHALQRALLPNSISGRSQSRGW